MCVCVCVCIIHLPLSYYANFYTNNDYSHNCLFSILLCNYSKRHFFLNPKP